MGSAQYDNPPNYYVENLCKAIDGAPAGADIIGRIAAGLNASTLPLPGIGGSCHYVFTPTRNRSSAWSWQVCLYIYFHRFNITKAIIIISMATLESQLEIERN